MDTFIVTGANGFIGRHLVRYLLENGADVYAIVLPGKASSMHEIRHLPKERIIEGQLENWVELAEQCPLYPKAIYHLAWNGVSPEERDNMDMQLINIHLSLNAIHLADMIHAERIIMPGSTMEYANYSQVINKFAVPSPLNSYGAVKLSVRYLSETLCRQLKIAYNYVIITSIYSEDRKDNNVIYYAIRELLNNRKPRFTNLEQNWDFIHISDVVRAMYLIAKRGKSFECYSVGYGDNQPLKKYICKIRDMIDSSLPLGIGDIPYKNGIQPSSCVDLTALRQDTGFVPKVPFEEGIYKVIRKISLEG